MMKVEIVLTVLTLAIFTKAQNYCDCPNGDNANIVLSGTQDSREIKSPPAVCIKHCTTMVSTSDMYSEIRVDNIQIPSSLNLTILDGNGRPLNQNCGGSFCNSNTTTVTITFDHTGIYPTDDEATGSVRVSTILNPYLTTTYYYSNWSSSSTTTIRNSFPFIGCKNIIFAMIFFKIFV